MENQFSKDRSSKIKSVFEFDSTDPKVYNSANVTSSYNNNVFFVPNTQNSVMSNIINMPHLIKDKQQININHNMLGVINKKEKNKVELKLLKHKSVISENIFMYVPCTNCNSYIHIDEVEKHTNICRKVKKDVKSAESSLYSYKLVNHRITKLKDSINTLMNSGRKNNKIRNELHFLSSLKDYLSDGLEYNTINNRSLVALKKLLASIAALIMEFKGSTSTYIFLERSKVLLLDKLNILKEDFKKKLDSKKINERKSGSLLKNPIEGDFKNLPLRKHETSETESFTPYRENNLISDSGEGKENLIDSNLVITSNNFIDDINSEISSSNLSNKNSISDATSMSSGSELQNSAFMEVLTSPKKGQEYLDKSNNSSNPPNSKDLFREFSKEMLKLKFEKLSKQHKGQAIPAKIVWKEALKLKIPKSQWRIFIYKELQNYSKYASLNTSRRNSKLKPIETIFEEYI